MSLPILLRAAPCFTPYHISTQPIISQPTTPHHTTRTPTHAHHHTPTSHSAQSHIPSLHPILPRLFPHHTTLQRAAPHYSTPPWIQHTNLARATRSVVPSTPPNSTSHNPPLPPCNRTGRYEVCWRGDNRNRLKVARWADRNLPVGDVITM